MRAAAVLLPIAYAWSTFDRFVVPKLVVARFLVLALAFLFCIRVVSTRRLAWRRTPLDAPLLAFLGSAALSSAFSVNLNVAVFGTYGRYDGLLTLCTYAAMFWLVTQTIAGENDARSLLRALLVGGYMVAAIAILQFLRDSVTAHTLVRAYGTMGNSDILGAYLVLLVPVAYGELIAATTTTARWLAINALAVMLLALLVSVSRSAWLGLLVAALVLLTARQWPAFKHRASLIGAAAVALAVAVTALVALEHGFSTSGLVSSTETITQRVHVWGDSLPLIVSRPLTGYGPDSFGLVYPGFQTGNWGAYQQFDKAHNELVQVAATQGLLGLGAYLWLLASFGVAFWRGRDRPIAWSLFAGWLAYVTALQLNFSALAAAFPFWMFSSAAIKSFVGPREPSTVPVGPILRAAFAAASTVLLILAVVAVGATYVADTRLQQAVLADLAGGPDAARLAADARRLAPQESVYAVEAGNIAFERNDWSGARNSYLAASRLGTFNPQMYRNLAFADRALGLRADALWAARQAVYLDRFDPVNQAVLAQMESISP